MGKSEKGLKLQKTGLKHKKFTEKTSMRLDNDNRKSRSRPPPKQECFESSSDESDDGDSHQSESEYDEDVNECAEQDVTTWPRNSSKHLRFEPDESVSEDEDESETEFSQSNLKHKRFEASTGMQSDEAEEEMQQNAESENSDQDDGEDLEDDEDLELEDKDENEIQNDLSKMSFAELQQLKEKIGLKMYNETVFGEQRQRRKMNFKRENKNRPREESSKRPVSMFRDTFQAKKKVPSDPRFDPRVGEFNERVFRETYSFIGDLRHKERGELEQMLRKEADPEQRRSIKKLLQRMKNQEATERQKGRRYQLNEEYHKFAAKSKEEGVTPKYLSEKERRQIELAQRFKELKKSGKLDKYLEKKRKKNMRKERKYLPGDT